MDAEINNVTYMELNSGPKIANSTCGKTIDVETIDRDSTVYETNTNKTGLLSVTTFQCISPISGVLGEEIFIHNI